MTTDQRDFIEATDGPTPPLSAGTASDDLLAGAERARLGWRRRVLRRRLKTLLIVWDALVAAASLTVAAQVSGWAGGTEINGGPAHSTDALALLMALAAPVGLAAAGAYHMRRRRGSSRLMFAGRLLLVGVVLSWVAIIVSAAAKWPVDFSQMLVLALLMPTGWLVGRAFCDRHPAVAVDRVLLVGSGSVANRVTGLTRRHRERRMQIVGRVDEDARQPVDGVPVLGQLSEIGHVIARHEIDRVIVTFTAEPDALLLNRLRECVGEGVQVDIVPRFYDLVGPNPRAHSLGGLALMEVPGRGLTISQRAAKRALDIVGAGVILLLLAPVLLVIATLIAVVDGRPVFFRQTRVGRYGREFSIVKYRTMRTDADAQGVARLAALADEGGQTLQETLHIPDVVHELKNAGEARVTPLGDFLRRTSLDELPQLLNVVRGDMSLVGPRPLRPFEVAFLAPWQRARQELRPGLTGLWQVMGRSAVEWDERMQLDYSYVSHWSLASDLRILVRTLPAVLRKDGAV
jgi:exopolysaccharide biosynthesis polyprenyl glycosylphosphotransferase